MKKKDMKKEDMKKENITIASLTIITGLVLLSIPAIISGLMHLNFFSHALGSADGWLCYWGGYLGAIIGLAAVTVTTQFQIANQNRLHKEQLKQQIESINTTAELNDKIERERIYYSIIAKQNEEIISILVTTFELSIKRFNRITDMANVKDAIDVLNKIYREGNLSPELITEINRDIKEKYDELNKLRNMDTSIRGDLVTKLTILKIKADYFPQYSKEVWRFCNSQQASYMDFVNIIKDNTISSEKLRAKVVELKQEFEVECTNLLEKFKKEISMNLNNFKK